MRVVSALMLGAALSLGPAAARADDAKLKIVQIQDCPAGFSFVTDEAGTTNFAVTFRDDKNSVAVHFQAGLPHPMLTASDTSDVNIVTLNDVGREELIRSISLGKSIHIELDEDLSGREPKLALLRWDVGGGECPKKP